MYTTVKLVQTENDLPITPETHPDFYYDFQVGVLLALREEGMLTEIQYRNAETALTQQRKTASHRKEKGRGVP